MPVPSQNRISVVRGRQVVPLMPVSRAAQQRTGQPWRGILLERHSIGAIEIPEHQHRELCLHLQLSGSPNMEWWSEGQNRIEETAPGSMILLRPGTQDRLHWQGGSERLVLSLQPDLLQSVAEEWGGSFSNDMVNRWALKDPALANVLLEMAKEVDAGWPLGALYADLLGVGLAGMLLRRYVDSPLKPNASSGRMPLPRLRRTLEFMSENLHRDLHLEEIAREVDLTPFHFARVFRESAGQTPYQYLLDQRIDRAKALLRSTSWPVQQIAQQTGFSSPVNFVRAFRQRVGVTPGAWREQRK